MKKRMSIVLDKESPGKAWNVEERGSRVTW